MRTDNRTEYNYRNGKFGFDLLTTNEPSRSHPLRDTIISAAYELPNYNVSLGLWNNNDHWLPTVSGEYKNKGFGLKGNAVMTPEGINSYLRASFNDLGFDASRDSGHTRYGISYNKRF